MNNKRNKSNDILNNISKRIKKIENKLKKPSKKREDASININLSTKIKEQAIQPIESWTLHMVYQMYFEPNILR